MLRLHVNSPCSETISFVDNAFRGVVENNISWDGETYKLYMYQA
jgi:hypothetical protein